MKIDLARCPMCRSGATLAQNIDDEWWIFCVNDECKCNVGFFKTRDEAYLAWRPSQHAEAEKLAKALSQDAYYAYRNLLDSATVSSLSVRDFQDELARKLRPTILAYLNGGRTANDAADDKEQALPNNRKLTHAVEELQAFATLIRRPPLDDVLMTQNLALRIAKAIETATGAVDGLQEAFGYWVEQKGVEPVLLRKPAYVPEPSDLRTVTPLYAAEPR